METLKVTVQPSGSWKEEALRNVALAETGEEITVRPTYNFSSWERLHDLLNPNRLEIVRVMSGKGPMRVRDIARLVSRDIKNVHGDLTRLTGNGFIDKTDDGFVFPYDGVHIEFDMQAAA